MDKGWVKLHRSITENHFLMYDDTCFALFMKLLLSVGRSKGEISGGRKALAKQFNMPEYVFYRAMGRLEKEEIVHKVVHSTYTTYRICNWTKYQDNSTAPAQDSAQYPHSTRTAPAHYNKNKKENKNIQVLALVNEKLGRNFKVIPSRVGTTISLFDLDDIGKALEAMKSDAWIADHSPSLDYLLRATTIDSFLNKQAKPVRDRFEEARRLGYA